MPFRRLIILLGISLLFVSSASGQGACDYEFEDKLVETGESIQASILVRDDDGNLVEKTTVRFGGWAPFLSIDDPKLFELGQHVGRLDICWESDQPNMEPESIPCTATLIAENKILTNHHCPFGDQYIQRLRQEERYITGGRLVMGLNRTGMARGDGVKTYSVRMDTRFENSSADSDAAILRVGGRPNDDWGHFPLSVADNIRPGERVVIIHHPGGEPKKVSKGVSCSIHRSQNQSTNHQIRHICPTEGGSSGSLILRASDYAVVGLHNEGGWSELDPDSSNKGIEFGFVAATLGLNPPIVSPPTDETAAQAALAELNFVFDLQDKIERLEAILQDFPRTQIASLVREQLPKLRQQLANQRASAAQQQREDAARAAYDLAISQSPISARISALQAVARRHSNTEFGDRALSEASRLEREQEELAAVRRETQAVSQTQTPSSSDRPPGEVFSDPCIGCPQMVVIPAGSFMMGSPDGEVGRFDDEGPQKHVMIERSFALGETEVTVGEFRDFVRATGHDAGDRCWIYDGDWNDTAGKGWDDPDFTQNDDHPVTCVNWLDANAYVDWLNSKVDGEPYRLPSEAEWEYAARAKTRGTSSNQTMYYWGDNRTTQVCRYANGADASTSFDWQNSSCNDKSGPGTWSSGSGQANNFGLYDMIGNVWEWTSNCYTESHAINADQNCEYRVLRGGSWNVIPRFLRSADRFRIVPTNRSYNFGFRVLRDL